ncbi:MAG: hypothetical protein KF901_03305 [Myxococcales bacterium]|nr:hypothetical protein [Myxococcales bacterium]
MTTSTTTRQLLRATRGANVIAAAGLCLLAVPCAFVLGAGLPMVAIIAGRLAAEHARVAFGDADRRWPMGLLAALGVLAHAGVVMLSESHASDATSIGLTVACVVLAVLALSPLLSIASAALDPSRPPGVLPTVRAGLRDARAAGWRHRFVAVFIVLALVVGPLLAAAWWARAGSGLAIATVAFVLLAGPAVATPVLIAHAVAARARHRHEHVERGDAASPTLLRAALAAAVGSATLGGVAIALALLVPLPAEVLPPYEALVHPTRHAPLALPGTSLVVRSTPRGLSVEAHDGGGVGEVRFAEGAIDYVGARREGEEITIYVRREGSMRVGVVRVDPDGARRGDRFGDRAKARLGVTGFGLVAAALLGLLGLAAAAARHARVVSLASPRPGRDLLRGRIVSDATPRWEVGAVELGEGARFHAADRRVALAPRLEVIGGERGAPSPDDEVYLLGTFERVDESYRAGEPTPCPADAALWIVTPSEESTREAYRWAVLTSALVLPVVAAFVGVLVMTLTRL